MTPIRQFTDRALVIGLTLGSKANNPLHEHNRQSEAKFREMLGESVELFGIDLQMNFTGKPDPHLCSPNTILEDATNLATLETFSAISDGGFALVTFDSHTEQYCPHFVHAPLVTMYYLNKLRVGGRYIMSACVEMMDFVTPTVDFRHEQNQGVLRNRWARDGSLVDATTGEQVTNEAAAHAFTLKYIEEHSDVHPTIHDPLIVITKNANVKLAKVDEALREMRERG